MSSLNLSAPERAAINAGAWFASLSAELRHDILRLSHVRRLHDGDLISAQGEPAREWIACAKGAVRVSSTTLSGKQVVLTYIEPGAWFGEVALFDGEPRTHDTCAHGDTTLVCVRSADFHDILRQHCELCGALLRLQSGRMRQLFGLLEDLNSLPLRARLAKQLLHLAHHYGVAVDADSPELRIGLHLAQEELAQLLGASRQRVNQDLKAMEREHVIRIEASGLVLCQPETLQAIAQSEACGSH